MVLWAPTCRIVRSLQDVWKIRGPLICIMGVYGDCLYRTENVVLFQLVVWSLYRPLSVAYMILCRDPDRHLWSVTIIVCFL